MKPGFKNSDEQSTMNRHRIRSTGPDVLENRTLPAVAFTQLPVLPEMDPATVGLESIGHLGFFRRNAEKAIWPPVVDYLRGPPSDIATNMPLA